MRPRMTGFNMLQGSNFAIQCETCVLCSCSPWRNSSAHRRKLSAMLVSPAASAMRSPRSAASTASGKRLFSANAAARVRSKIGFSPPDRMARCASVIASWPSRNSASEVVARTQARLPAASALSASNDNVCLHTAIELLSYPLLANRAPR